MYALFLSHNQLSGSIPKSLENLDINQIDLSRNKLEGDASMLFGAQKTTHNIDLSRNMFQFNISMVKVSKTVNFLHLNHNGLTGTIPIQWTQLDLQIFNVSYNRLCGRIPQGGELQRFDAYAYLHNKCLCGPPLQSCKWGYRVNLPQVAIKSKDNCIFHWQWIIKTWSTFDEFITFSKRMWFIG